MRVERLLGRVEWLLGKQNKAKNVPPFANCAPANGRVSSLPLVMGRSSVRLGIKSIYAFLTCRPTRFNRFFAALELARELEMLPRAVVRGLSALHVRPNGEGPVLHAIDFR